MYPVTVKKFLFLLLVAFAAVSLVSSVSIPRKRDIGHALNIAKRAAKAAAEKPAAAAAAAETSKAAAPKPASSSSKRPAATSTRATSSRAVTSAPASTSAPATSAPVVSTSASSSAAADAASTDSNASASGSGAGSSSAVPTTSPTDSTTATPVPTSGLSTTAVGGIAAVGCVAVLGAAVFAFTRYRRKASLTQNLSTKSVNQFSATPYSPSPFPQGNNTGYERLSDPSLSAPSSVPSGVPQGLGTYAVISTYTPTLGDELEIQPGDKVTIIVEYDDGWCQGINESRGGVKGVFPRHCVDIGGQGGGMEDMVGNKRVSSMYGGGYRM